LGHTLGHVLESVHQLPHGLAVAQGLHFALAVSRKLGFLTETDLHYLGSMLRDRFGLTDRSRELPKIPQRRFMELLGQDKKRTTDASIRFVVVAQVGHVQTVSLGLSALCELAIEQGYVLAE
jgi:3-dehydroquinate synthetase